MEHVLAQVPPAVLFNGAKLERWLRARGYPLPTLADIETARDKRRTENPYLWRNAR